MDGSGDGGGGVVGQDDMQEFKDIKSYIAAQPKAYQPLLKNVYSIVKAAAPRATEAIKYGMPTFVGKKNLVHFMLAKRHLGFYPTPSAVVHFAKELAKYPTSKGAIQFPLDMPVPKTLITKMVRFRVKEDSLLKKS